MEDQSKSIYRKAVILNVYAFDFVGEAIKITAVGCGVGGTVRRLLVGRISAKRKAEHGLEEVPGRGALGGPGPRPVLVRELRRGDVEDVVIEATSVAPLVTSHQVLRLHRHQDRVHILEALEFRLVDLLDHSWVIRR